MSHSLGMGSTVGDLRRLLKDVPDDADLDLEVSPSSDGCICSGTNYSIASFAVTYNPPLEGRHVVTLEG